MLVRVGLVSGSVIALNVWQVNKVHAAEPSTSQQPIKMKIRPSEVSAPILPGFYMNCYFLSTRTDSYLHCWLFSVHRLGLLCRPKASHSEYRVYRLDQG